MKNKLIKRMRLILVVTVILVAAVVFAIVFTLTTEAMFSDIRQRAIGVKDFIVGNLYSEDFIDIGKDTPASIAAEQNIQEILDSLHGIGNLARLYIAIVGENGQISTTLRVREDGDRHYVPSGTLEQDLRESIERREAVFSSGIYQTERGRVYYLFWPVLDESYDLIGVVGMEFDAAAIHESQVRAALYSALISLAFIILISFVSYISLNKATEPFYKKLAYTDVMTGYENRMAFEHKLKVCNEIAKSGKSVTLFVFDVNNLKAVNDTLGHDYGDLYLKNTADVLSSIIADRGMLYRIGGDEFASLIIGKRQEDIENIVSELRSEKKEMIKGRKFCCAFGHATFTKDLDETLRDVFKRADNEMYEEKLRQKSYL